MPYLEYSGEGLEDVLMKRFNTIPDYGLREDGTPKGQGWLGPLKMTDKSGRVMSEFSIGTVVGGKETLIPSIVPTLSQEEINHLLGGGGITDAIAEKARKHAEERLRLGLSPFKE